MEFGYEERSKKLIERLDRIQKYLQSLPPLPKIGSVETPVVNERSRSEIHVQSAECQTNKESDDSDGSSTSVRSVATKPSRTIPKSDYACELLQQSVVDSPDVSKAVASGSSSTTDVGKMKKKRRRDVNKVHDPLKPTTRRSFGVDIGQGINVINYIKQNAKPGADARNKRLAGIITKDPERGLHTEKSMERFYKLGPLTADTSSMSIQLKSGEEETKRAGIGHKPSSLACAPNPSRPSDADVYRVRYHDRAVELPHHHGLDALQALFVPFTEHDDSYPDAEPGRNASGC